MDAVQERGDGSRDQEREGELMSDIEYTHAGWGGVEARDAERAPGVVGRGASERGAAAELERLIVSTWHPARVGRLQEAIDAILAGGTIEGEAGLELQRFFDDSIGFHRRDSEAWASQEHANDREGGSYSNRRAE
jgi:hypothetical protein